MATYFVDSAGSNTSPYDTEAKAANSIVTVAALWAAGDIVRVKSTHSETAGVAITLTFPSTPGLRILSVAFDGSGTGALTAGAVIAVGAANAAMNLGAGFVYAYGITWTAGTNNNSSCDLQVASAASATGHVYDNCTFSLPSTNSGALLSFGAGQTVDYSGIQVDLNNCTWNNGNQAGRSLTFRGGRFNVRGLSLAGTAPTTVFDYASGVISNVVMSASDFSGVAYTNLVNVATTTAATFVAALCKLRSGANVNTGTFGGPGAAEVVLIDCDSGDNHYTYYYASWAGTVTASNTIYAAAGNGTDSISWKMESSANASFEWPLRSPPISRFNSALSAMTVKVPVVNDGVTFKDNEAWLELLYKGTAGSPIGTWDISDRAADILAAGANQTTDTTSWTGTGGFTSAVKQELKTGSLTPAEIGPLTGVVCLAKPSSTLYVSPLLEAA